MREISLALSRKQYFVSISVLGAIGAISLAAGLYNAWSYFMDFQQSAACLFISGDNPYLAHLEGRHRENWTPPNYLHPLYILQSPLCLFDDATARLVWGAINTILAIWICYTLAKMAKHREYFLPVTLFLFASLPFRIGIGNDQNQILILTLFILSMQASASWLRGLFGSLSFMKYSFAGSWIGMNIYHDRHSVVWSVFFVALLMLGGALWISSGDFSVDFLGPFMVAAHGVAAGHGDLLTIIDYLYAGQPPYRTVIGGLLLILNIIVVAWITRNSTDALFILSVAGVGSLMFVTHLIYDGVFLLPALVFLLVKGGAVSLLGLAAIVYTWQIVKVLDVLNISETSIEWTVLHFFVYLILMASLIISERKSNRPLLILPSIR